MQSKNSFGKANVTFNKFCDKKNSFEKRNSADKKELYHNLLSYGSLNEIDLQNQKEESKNLKEIKKSLEQLNCDIEANFTKSIRSPLNNNYFKTEGENLNYSPKKLISNLTIDNYNLNIDRNSYNANMSSPKNKLLSQNNFNFIYDINNNKNNVNSLNSLNSFSFYQSPKNNSNYQINQTANYINSNPNVNGSPYKIVHPNVLSYIPDLVTNNIQLVEPFQNILIKKLINKNNPINKSQLNENLLVQNTVNETLTNSIKMNQNVNNKKNRQNNLNTSEGNRSKSMGRSGKFISEMLKKFNIGAGENSKSINNYNEKSNSKSKIKEYSHDNILIEDENKFKELRDSIKKIKLNKKIVKSPNTLNDPTIDLISLNEKINKKGINNKIKKLIEENRMLLFDNLNSADPDLLNNKNETSRCRIKSKYSNSNFNINEQKYLNTASNFNSHNANKYLNLRDKSKDQTNLDYTSETRNKSKLDLQRSKNENIKNLINKNIPYILSEDNFSSRNYKQFKSSNKSKPKLEDKINFYIDNKIEENKELKSARYTNEKKLEDLNRKFNEKLRIQIKSKKITKDEDYKIVLDSLTHSDKSSWKEFIVSKNKELEQDIQISDEKLSEFKDKFLKNFGKEPDREHINSFYVKLVTSGNNYSNNKDSIFSNKLIFEDNKLNEVYSTFEKKSKIEEKIVFTNLKKLKSLLNLEERDSRDMKFYNNNNYNNNLKMYSTKNSDNSSKNNFNQKSNIYLKNNMNNSKFDSKFNKISGLNYDKVKTISGNSLKLVFQNNTSGNSVLPKNDLMLDDLKMKKICQINNYKYNF